MKKGKKRIVVALGGNALGNTPQEQISQVRFAAEIIADLVAGAGHYRNKVVNLLSYMLMSLGGVYTYVVFFIDPQGWASTMLENGTEQSYIDTMSASAPSWLLAVIMIGTLAIAAFSGWIGGKLLKKQFEKAGITA